MDDVASFNQARWDALARDGALFTRPALHLDAASARARIDPDGWLGPLDGARVLCLASGGGQQSAAFALLGAHVTVVDLSAAQLAEDRRAARHYRLTVATLQADMRDLSALDDSSMDLVYQPYSINFVPDVQPVFREVVRVLRPGGRYLLQFANPFTLGVNPRAWTGTGYLLQQPYHDGASLTAEDEDWVYAPTDDSATRQGTTPAIPPPREYRHALGTVINGLVTHRLSMTRFSEQTSVHPDPAATPGTWDHFVAYAPPWFTVLCTVSPGAASPTDGDHQMLDQPLS